MASPFRILLRLIGALLAGALVEPVVADAQTYPSKAVRVIVPFPRGRGTGSRRGGWCWGGDGARPAGAWQGILLRLISALLAGALVEPVVADAQTYPSKAVRVIVPFPPAGGVDIVGRVIAGKLADALGQQFVIDNRPGASGNLGTAIVSRSPPDGYTLLFFPASVVSSYVLIGKAGYNMEKDLRPISLVAAAPNILCVHPSLPVRNVKDLIALARLKPGELNFGSAGIGGIPHLTGELFKLQAKVDIVHVPYKGTPAAVMDLTSGQISLVFANTLSVVPYIKTGRLRALAITSAKRSASAPELPTIAESGLPGFEAATWFGMLAPGGTPQEIVTRISDEMQKIVRTKSMTDMLITQGADPIGSTSEEFRDRISADIIKWTVTIKAAGLHPQ